MITPRQGDYLVLYPAQLAPNSRIELLLLEANGSRVLVRTTFATAPDAGGRFERVALTMAQAAGTRAFRSIADAGLFTVLNG
jgi:hypothetical protein